MALELIWLCAFASLVAGVATGLGALPTLFMKEISHRMGDTMLWFAVSIDGSSDPSIRVS